MNLSGNANLSFSGSATAVSRMNLGVHHLFAACRAVARIGQAEKDNAGKPFGEFWEPILHDSLVVATTTVASLESYANELYFEGKFIGTQISAQASRELGDLIDQKSLLRKFSTALAFRSDKQLDFGTASVQNVDALINLRNLIVHYRSEWSHQQGPHQKLSNQLKYKFEPSPFLPEHEPLFPKGWASHSFGCWAVWSTYAFMAHFYSEAGAENPLDIFKSRIEQLSGCAL